MKNPRKSSPKPMPKTQTLPGGWRLPTGSFQVAMPPMIAIINPPIHIIELGHAAKTMPLRVFFPFVLFFCSLYFQKYKHTKNQFKPHKKITMLALDGSFGTAGVVNAPLGGTSTRALAVQIDNQLVAV